MGDLVRKQVTFPMLSDKGLALTEKEKLVLASLAEDMTLHQIAEQLGISYHTVISHIRQIYSKLSVHSRSAAVAKTIKEKLI